MIAIMTKMSNILSSITRRKEAPDLRATELGYAVLMVSDRWDSDQGLPSYLTFIPDGINIVMFGRGRTIPAPRIALARAENESLYGVKKEIIMNVERRGSLEEIGYCNKMEGILYENEDNVFLINERVGFLFQEEIDFL